MGNGARRMIGHEGAHREAKMALAFWVVKLEQYLPGEQEEFVLAKQVFGVL